MALHARNGHRFIMLATGVLSFLPYFWVGNFGSNNVSIPDLKPGHVYSPPDHGIRSSMSNGNSLTDSDDALQYQIKGLDPVQTAASHASWTPAIKASNHAVSSRQQAQACQNPTCGTYISHYLQDLNRFELLPPFSAESVLELFADNYAIAGPLLIAMIKGTRHSFRVLYQHVFGTVAGVCIMCDHITEERIKTTHDASNTRTRRERARSKRISRWLWTVSVVTSMIALCVVSYIKQDVFAGLRLLGDVVVTGPVLAPLMLHLWFWDEGLSLGETSMDDCVRKMALASEKAELTEFRRALLVIWMVSVSVWLLVVQMG